MPSPIESAEFLTINDAARVLNLSHKSVRRRIANGEFDVFRVGTGPKAPIRIAVSDLVSYLHESNRR